MKLFSAFLVLFVLFLQVTPCADEAFEFGEETVECQANDCGEEEKEQEADLCSPFCTCHCCHTHSFRFNTEQIADYKYFSESSTQEVINYFESFSANIWQPPKLS